MKYEELMDKLEKIVRDMESGKLSIDDSIKSYNEGIKLCQECKKILDEAKGKVLLLNDENKEEEFKVNDDE